MHAYGKHMGKHSVIQVLYTPRVTIDVFNTHSLRMYSENARALECVCVCVC